jgi:hypothetical protein
MKIKWTDGLRLVPGVGTLDRDDERDIPDEIAQALIKQGQAEKVTKKPRKGGEK